jgi:Trypsin-co-occurring domain 1
MENVITFPLEDGGSIMVETDPYAGGSRPVTRSGDPTRGGAADRAARASGDAAFTLESAVARATPAFRAIVSRLQSGTNRPDEIHVELGLKLTAEAGAVIARTAGEGNVRVTLRWQSGRSVE